MHVTKQKIIQTFKKFEYFTTFQPQKELRLKAK